MDGVKTNAKVAATDSAGFPECHASLCWGVLLEEMPAWGFKAPPVKDPVKRQQWRERGRAKSLAVLAGLLKQPYEPGDGHDFRVSLANMPTARLPNVQYVCAADRALFGACKLNLSAFAYTKLPLALRPGWTRYKVPFEWPEAQEWEGSGTTVR